MNILSYSVLFIKKNFFVLTRKIINLLRLFHWCFPEKFVNFSGRANGGVLWKKLFLKIFVIRTGKLQACNFIKRRLQHKCFPLNTATFVRTSILKNICWRLLAAASDFLKQLQNSGEQLLFLISDNSSTDYEQWSY